MKPVPRWRIAAAIAVLLALLGFGVLFAPIYAHNLELERYVVEITRNASAPDTILLEEVLDKARVLNLPVTAENVHITRSPEHVRIDVGYFVRATLPGYTVDLHFHPSSGGR